MVLTEGTISKLFVTVIWHRNEYTRSALRGDGFNNHTFFLIQIVQVLLGSQNSDFVLRLLIAQWLTIDKADSNDTLNNVYEIRITCIAYVDWFNMIRIVGLHLVHTHQSSKAPLGWRSQSAKSFHLLNYSVTSFVISDHFLNTAVFHDKLLYSMNHGLLLFFQTLDLSGAHTFTQSFAPLI